jgi:hypothetical protein
VPIQSRSDCPPPTSRGQVERERRRCDRAIPQLWRDGWAGKKIAAHAEITPPIDENVTHKHDAKRAIQECIRQAMAPANYLSTRGRHEAMWFRLNQAVVLAGLRCTGEGKLERVEAATTLTQPESGTRGR